MKNYKIFTVLMIGLCILLMSYKPLQAQSKARIDNIDFNLEGSNLIITYDIIKAKTNETFNIRIKVLTGTGEEIIPSALTGDINEGVTGGTNKRVIWDLEADNAYIDEEISIEILASPESLPEIKKESIKKSGVSVGGALALSALLPGLGNRVVKGSGAQWLLGLVGYGCIGGSIVMNNSAYNAYEDYKDATTSNERDDLFKQSENKELYSKILMGTAVTIWVADLIWTGLQAGKARKNSGKSNFSFNYSYNPYTMQPMIGFRYRF
jgi:hypothetical protein